MFEIAIEVYFFSFNFRRINTRNGIVEFKISKDDDTIFDYIDQNHSYWYDSELDEDEISEIKENMSDNREGSDYYYGVDRYYWECLKRDISEAEVKVLKDCGILKKRIIITGIRNMAYFNITC